ncbi:putative signal peptide protein [Puccinia sorghi]|uniref:Putative signal peptide protein n=1 Tax=Puccinia sorghi TaxID=27349 RepID=A0A0L6V681_9BASI|nr:putative signal peptide protein [Puccinia sorghi]
MSSDDASQLLFWVSVATETAAVLIIDKEGSTYYGDGGQTKCVPFLQSSHRWLFSDLRGTCCHFILDIACKNNSMFQMSVKFCHGLYTINQPLFTLSLICNVESLNNVSPQTHSKKPQVQRIQALLGGP